MAVVNCCISVTSSATPLSQDSPNASSASQQSASQTPIPTKILLPKKKPLKWSTGVAPGEWGGPPTTSKLRKYWGGGNEDPLASDDFMWNKDFMSQMKRLIDDPNGDESLAERRLSSSKEEPSGFLSLNRMMSLDSMEVDLSKELTTSSKPLKEEFAEEIQTSGTVSQRWRAAPTRREQDKWERASKAATGGSEEMFREMRRPKGDPEVLAAQSRDQYFQLKKKLQFLTLGIGGVGLLSAYISYSPEITARSNAYNNDLWRSFPMLISKYNLYIFSYGVGLLGSLAYMRMLGKTVDSMADGARGLIKGAVGQPRLLVPVVLVMVYNRWNEILVPEYGFLHLQLIPMLVGFFTYKIATFSLAIEDALNVVGEKPQA